MRSRIACVIVVFGALVAMGFPAWAGSSPTLTAPQNFVCAYVAGTDSIDCTWDVLDGATKYSVDVVASYDVDENLTIDQTLSFSFSTFTNSISIAVSDLNRDFTDDATDNPSRAVLADLAGKGLNPTSGHSNKSQNNPFSAVQSVVIPAPPE